MYVLMQCVAEAVMAKGVRGLVEMVPGAAFLYDVASESLRRLKDRKRADQLRDEILTAAAAGFAEAKEVAARVAKEVAAAGPVEDRIALEMYLMQIPGAVRQSLRRADDPAGKSVPAGFALAEPLDLLKRLPARIPHFRPGDALPGKPGWQLAELLGTGGFGEVWLARNPALAALKGAVKFGLDPRAREQLLRHEGGLVSRVMEHGRHPNVVPLLDAHLDGDAPWLMYEYIPGGDLTGLIHAWQALPPADRVAPALAALRTLAAAVGHFHRLEPPLVHRDLKPANILVQADSGAGAVRVPSPTLLITDFGIGGLAAAAAIADVSRRSSGGALMSQLWGSHTPLYASPQQQRGDPPDPRDDVHALGVIGFQMLTGRLDAALGADYAKTLRRLAVPDPVIELLGDCGAHDADNRPRDAAALAAAIGRLVPPAPPPPADDIVPTVCPSCHVPLQIPMAGNRPARCPQCGATFRPIVIEPAARPRPDSAVRPRPVARPVDVSHAPRPVRAEADRPRRSRPDDDDRPRRRRNPEAAEPDPRARWRGSRIAGLLILISVLLLIGIGLLVALSRSFSPTPFPPKPSPGVQRIASFGGIAGQLRSLDYSPDGRHLLAVNEAGTVQLVNAEDGTAVVTVETGIPGHRPAFSRDGTRLVVARPGKGARIWNAVDGKEVRDLAGLEEQVVALAVSPDDRWVVAGGAAGTVVVWDVVGKGALPKLLLEGHGDPDRLAGITAIVFDTQGRSLATAAGAEIKVWKVEGWTGANRALESGAKVTALAFTPDGKQLVAGGADGRPRAWAFGEKTQSGGAPDGPLGAITRVAVFPDNHQVVVTDVAGVVGLWDLTRGGPVAPFKAGLHGEVPLGRVAAVALAPAGNLMATGGDDRAVLIWEMFFKKPRVKLLGHNAAVLGVAFRPDGKRLATADTAGTVIVWDVPKIEPGLGDPVEVR